MRKVAFIGGYDKADLMIYTCKIIKLLGKRILYVDTSLTEKTKYIVPTMNPTSKYVTTFDGIDIAVGFENTQELNEYIGVSIETEYEYILFDIDNPEKYTNFGLTPKDLHFFVTSFDVYSVQRGIDVLKAITELTDITKVFFTKDAHSEEGEYLDFATFNYRVKWNKEVVYFPFDTSDLYAIFLNQRFSKVRFSGLSSQYIDCIAYLVELITGTSNGEIKRAVKKIDRA